MFSETPAQAEIQYRQQRFLDEAAAHRLAQEARKARKAQKAQKAEKPAATAGRRAGRVAQAHEARTGGPAHLAGTGQVLRFVRTLRQRAVERRTSADTEPAADGGGSAVTAADRGSAVTAADRGSAVTAADRGSAVTAADRRAA
jgi:hypothetical protein